MELRILIFANIFLKNEFIVEIALLVNRFLSISESILFYFMLEISDSTLLTRFTGRRQPFEESVFMFDERPILFYVQDFIFLLLYWTDVDEEEAWTSIERFLTFKTRGENLMAVPNNKLPSTAIEASRQERYLFNVIPTAIG